MSHHTRRQVLRTSGAAGLLAALGAGHVSAQALDVVRIITGFPPGGTSDTLCRRVAEGLKGGSYAKVALVENKAGAGGQIAVQAMKGAPTDGSVILQTPASMLVIYPHIYKKLGYDPFVDVTAITMACTFDFAWAVGPAVPVAVKTVPEFLAWCKANPAMANFGSPAAGSVPHFIGVLLSRPASS
jgi:tripartite-type tricarboxylate transporter receptor subunit TctC